MLARAGYQLFFTDDTLAPVGQLVDEWTDLTIVLRANTVGTITFSAPWSAQLEEWSQVDGARIVVLRDVGAGWEYLTSGPIEHDDDFDWQAGSGQSADPGTVTMYFGDDLAVLADRIVYPNPAVSSQAQTSTAKYTRTSVNAGTLMGDLVRLNAGADALAYRDTGVVLGVGAGVGGTIASFSSRFAPLLDALRSVALAGGVGFRVVQVAGPALEFQVFTPVDRSDTVRYSRGIGNIRSLSYRHQKAVSNVAIVGGDGTGTSRTIREYPSLGAVPSGGRREVFVSASTNDTDELAAAGADKVSQDAEQVQLSVEAIDTAYQRFGLQYGLHDLVGVEVRPGQLIVDAVTQVTIKVDRKGEQVTSTIGSGQPVTEPDQVALLRELQRRIGETERG